MIAEDDVAHVGDQYPEHKQFNERQAQDYREIYGMTITGIGAAHVTGPDKSRSVLDHVDCITLPARGQPVRLPNTDTMCCPILVDDVAEVFARVLLAPRPQHALYNTGGTAISRGGIAAIVRSCLPAATTEFDQETGGREDSENCFIDNRHLLAEFAVQYGACRERVLQIRA